MIVQIIRSHTRKTCACSSRWASTISVWLLPAEDYVSELGLDECRALFDQLSPHVLGAALTVRTKLDAIVEMAEAVNPAICAHLFGDRCTRSRGACAGCARSSRTARS